MINLTNVLKQDVERSGRGADFRRELAIKLGKSSTTIDGKLVNARDQDFTLNQLPAIFEVANELHINITIFGGALMGLLDNNAEPTPLAKSILKSISVLGQITEIADGIQEKPNQEETYKLLKLAKCHEELAKGIYQKLHVISES